METKSEERATQLQAAVTQSASGLEVVIAQESSVVHQSLRRLQEDNLNLHATSIESARKIEATVISSSAMVVESVEAVREATKREIQIAVSAIQDRFQKSLDDINRSEQNTNRSPEELVSLLSQPDFSHPGNIG